MNRLPGRSSYWPSAGGCFASERHRNEIVHDMIKLVLVLRMGTVVMGTVI